MDKYSNFKTLAEHEILNQDYKIQFMDIGSNMTIIAPHGGLIEPRTSLIAKLIAGNTFNYYCFEGIKKKNNRDLHITSHRFDEPGMLGLISSCDIVVTIHACIDTEDVIHVGGRFKELASHIQTTMEGMNIKVSRQTDRFPGTHPGNICNKARRKKGVQLEFSRGLRDDLQRLSTVSIAIGKALKTYPF